MVEATPSTGSLFTWGDNNYGKSGTGKKEKNLIVPCRVTTKPKQSFVTVSLNSHQGLTVNSEGSVFAFGLNSRQRIGLPVEVECSPTLMQVK